MIGSPDRTAVVSDSEKAKTAVVDHNFRHTGVAKIELLRCGIFTTLVIFDSLFFRKPTQERTVIGGVGKNEGLTL
jgi:hypothetical protein